MREGYQRRTIQMRSFPKERPDFAVRKGGKGYSTVTYMPADYQRRRELLRLQFGPLEVNPPVTLRVLAIHKMPASWSRAKRERMSGQYRTTTPDADNVLGGGHGCPDDR